MADWHAVLRAFAAQRDKASVAAEADAMIAHTTDSREFVRDPVMLERGCPARANC